MTCNTVKKLTEPLDKPEREFQRLRRPALRQHQNKSLAIAERNLFDDDASYCNDNRTKIVAPLKALREHSLLNLAGLDQTGPSQWKLKWLLVQIFYDNISQKDRGKLDQFAHFHFSSLTEEEGWNRIKEYVQYQDDLWDNQSSSMNISSITENDDIPPWGNCQQKGEKESGPKWVTRSKFEDELSVFMLEKKSHTKGIGEILDQHHKEIHEQFSSILTTIGENKILESGAPNFAITTRSGASTRDPPFPNSPQPTTTDHTERIIGREGSESEEASTFQN
ncbi:hypothetical protein Tco_0909630 [Tanacetum coccineum]|uniref:Uncharacterized protein n=1 Tax=Tanacetum coccineum TaxID=301880 RepID=A0ABQ5CQH8_9ASTR